MPQISHTPEPYSSTTISLTNSEQEATGITAILVFPPTVSATGEILPAGFQISYPSGAQGLEHGYLQTEDVPLQLRGTVRQIMTAYTAKGPVPAPPALSPQAERARSGKSNTSGSFLGLGRRAGKGRWI